MTTRDDLEDSRQTPGPARGVLHRHDSVLDVVHDRRLPAPELQPFIAHYWSVRWHLGAPIEVETLSHPSIHVVIERRFDRDGDDADDVAVRAEIAGPHRTKFARHLAGHGQVFGIKFRPAMFRAWWGSSTEALTDTAVPLSRLPRVDIDALIAVTTSSSSFSSQLTEVDALLRAARPVEDPDDIAIRDLVEAAAVDVDLIRLDDLVARSGLPLRTLQRRFKASVGVSAKWVLQRYRLHEAAEALRSSTPPTLADLAARLGYADQAHFARDFKATIGVSPGHWR